jgi:hypothetical protein
MNEPYQDYNQMQYDDNNFNAAVIDPDVANMSESSGTSMWVWVIIVIVVIVVIAGVIAIIWWATRKGPSSPNGPGPLSITGTDFTAVGANSIRATWTSVGDENDLVTLFVNPTGKEMKFDRDGNPLGNYRSSGAVSTPGTSATVGQLNSGVSYDAVLIVTNPNVGGANKAHSESAITPIATIPPGAKFNISASGQTGHIHYNRPSPNQVSYSLQAASVNDSLFMRDSDGFICATNLISPTTATTMCGDNQAVLYASTTSGTSTLNIGIKSSLDSTQLSQARWVYNSTGDNKWCLTGNGRCMDYSVNNPVLLQPVDSNGNGFTPLNPVGSGTTNGFTTLNPVGSGITPVTSSVEDTTKNQVIFVSPEGSKWVNTQINTN